MAITRIGGANAITGTIPTSVAPGKGKVLQIVRNYKANQSGGSVNTTSSTLSATGIQASITPTASGNLILVDWICSMTNKDASGNGTSKMYQKIGSAAIDQMSGASTYHVNYSSHDYNKYANSSFSGSYTATSTDVLLFEPYIRSNNGSTYQFVHVNASYALTLTEVEQ